MVKNSWKFAHTLEPAAVRTPLRLGPGRGTEALQRPLETPSENLMNSSHILARIHMKLGTHIDLHQAEQLFALHVMGSAQQEVGYSGLFKNHMLWNLKYSSQDFQHRSTKLGERDLKTLGMLNCGGDFWYLKRFARGEAMKLWRELRDRKCLIKSTYIVWFWSQFSGLFGGMKPIASMWQLWGKVIAPPTGSRKCVISKCFEFTILLLPQFASNFIRIL